MPGRATITSKVSISKPTPRSTTPAPISPSNAGTTRPLSNRRQKEAYFSQTPTRNLFKTIVTILIGPERHAFQVHKEMLCQASPFFAAAFDNDYNFSEASSGSLEFPDVRAIDFEFFVQWLYRHDLAHEELDVPKAAYFRLIRLYILADILRIEALRNDVIDMMIRMSEKWNSVPTPDDTFLLHEQVREKTALRKLVVDLFVYKKTDQLVEKHEDQW